MPNLDSYGKCMENHDNMISSALGESPRVIFSAYDTIDGLPVNNLNEVAIEGTVILHADVCDFWGDEDSEEYTSEVLENPTWLDVSICADKMIHAVGDFHHVFLEAVCDSGRTVDGVPVYHFLMGS